MTWKFNVIGATSMVDGYYPPLVHVRRKEELPWIHTHGVHGKVPLQEALNDAARLLRWADANEGCETQPSKHTFDIGCELRC